MKDWPDYILNCEWQEMEKLPKGKMLLINLKNDKDWTPGQLCEDGTILDGINEPGEEKTFIPTHWAHL